MLLKDEMTRITASGEINKIGLQRDGSFEAGGLTNGLYQALLSGNTTKIRAYTDALSAIHSWQGLGLPNAAQQALTSVNIAVRRGERRIAQKVNRLFDDIKAKANTITPYSLIDIENAINAIASSIPTQGRGSTNPTHFITFCKN